MSVYHCYYVPSDGIHYREVEAASPEAAVTAAASMKQLPGRWRVIEGTARDYELRERRSYTATEDTPGEPPF